MSDPLVSREREATVRAFGLAAIALEKYGGKLGKETFTIGSLRNYPKTGCP